MGWVTKEGGTEVAGKLPCSGCLSLEGNSLKAGRPSSLARPGTVGLPLRDANSGCQRRQVSFPPCRLPQPRAKNIGLSAAQSGRLRRRGPGALRRPPSPKPAPPNPESRPGRDSASPRGGDLTPEASGPGTPAHAPAPAPAPRTRTASPRHVGRFESERGRGLRCDGGGGCGQGHLRGCFVASLMFRNGPGLSVGIVATCVFLNLILGRSGWVRPERRAYFRGAPGPLTARGKG